MFQSRRHRRLPLVLALLTVAGIAACDNPTAPAPLSLNARTANVDSLSCTHGYILVQGVVSCLPGPG